MGDIDDLGATPETVPLDLLRRYMRHVCYEEGVTFAEHLTKYYNYFTAEERALLKGLSDAIHAEP